MTSVNELLASESVRHQVQLHKYSNESVRKMVAALNRADANLRSALMSVLSQISPSEFQVDRLESLLGSVRSINTQAYGQLNEELKTELKAFIDYETAYQTQLLVNFTPVAVTVASVDVSQVYAASMSRPFQGTLLRDALSELETSRAKMVRQRIAQGFLENKTTDEIVRSIFGTRANGYADGFLEGSRRDARTVTRTALSHMAGFVKDQQAAVNVDLIKAVQWQSTLDIRTSSVCQIRDHKLYEPQSHRPIGHSLSWLGGPGRAHWNCRSSQVFVLKSAKELGLDSPDVVLRNGTRASMDGQVAKETNFVGWLKDQSFTRQSDILGPTRAKLLRDGKLSPERMYDLKGQFRTLDQLRESDAAAFRRAGL